MALHGGVPEADRRALRRKVCLGLSVAALCVNSSAALAEGFTDIRALWEAARARAAQDPEASLADYERAIQASPGNNWLLRSAASAAISANDRERLHRWLARFASQGGAVTPEQMRSLAGLLDTDLIAQLERNRAAIERSSVWATLTATIPLVEGIAYDGTTGTLYVSSVAEPAIYRIAAGETPAKIALPPDIGSPMGMMIDDSGRTLWAAIDAAAPRSSPRPARSGLLRLDLATGTFDLIEGPTGIETHLGDVTAARDGTIIVADSQSGAAYECAPGCTVLQTLVPPGSLRSAQGMALSRDESRLYISDYAYGLAVFDRSSGTLDRLRTAPGVALDGIDGLLRVGDTLVAVQNGWNPARIIQIRLDERGTTAISASILERGHPLVSEPTQAALLEDGSIAFIANSQWESYGEGGLKEGRTQADTHILRLPMPPYPHVSAPPPASDRVSMERAE